MRWKSSHVFAAGILAVVFLYFIVRGVFGGQDRKAEAAQAERAAAASRPDPLVQTVLIEEQVRPYVVALRGRTEAARTVVVRSEAGRDLASS